MFSTVDYANNSLILLISVYKMDIVKQQVAMNKDITIRNCDIWQWDSMETWAASGYKSNGHYSIAPCEDECESEPTCNSVMLNYHGHYFTANCLLYKQPLREEVSTRNHIRSSKFHFCYGMWV